MSLFLDMMAENYPSDFTDQKRFFGKYSGEIVDIADPEEQGRVLVETAAFGEGDKFWCLPNTPYPGMFMIPKIGTKVWLEFEAGCRELPAIWTGCFWTKPNGKSEVPKKVYLHKKYICTDAGHYLLFDDFSGYIELMNGIGSQKIVLDKKGNILLRGVSKYEVRCVSSVLTTTGLHQVSVGGDLDQAVCGSSKQSFIGKATYNFASDTKFRFVLAPSQEFNIKFNKLLQTLSIGINEKQVIIDNIKNEISAVNGISEVKITNGTTEIVAAKNTKVSVAPGKIGIESAAAVLIKGVTTNLGAEIENLYQGLIDIASKLSALTTSGSPVAQQVVNGSAVYAADIAKWSVYKGLAASTFTKN